MHDVRPFINRIRYAPEVASKPERLEKDLANAKCLATILEEGAPLRRTKVKTEDEPPHESIQSEEQTDAVMAIPESADDIDDDPEPKENGSAAVEQKIEKIIADLREQGVVDINDEKAFEAKKVRNSCQQCFECTFMLRSISDCDFPGLVHCLPSGYIPCMLLLFRCNGSS